MPRRRTPRPARDRRVRGCLRAGLVLVLGLVLPGAGRTAADGEPEALRLGISINSFGARNRNDATAALKAWAATVVRERNFDIPPKVEVYEQAAELKSAVERGVVDVVTMTAQEFQRSGQAPDQLFLTARGSQYGEDYMLVTRRAEMVERWEGLKGRRLAHHVAVGTGLALPWLETQLAAEGLPEAVKFFGDLQPMDSPSKAVLRVFFRQAEACLVTSNAFVVTCEMNPQLGRDLAVFRTSPRLIPSLVFLREGFQGANRRMLVAAFLDLHSTPAGQQVLTVFQGSKLVFEPVACFEPTRRLLLQYDRVLDQRIVGVTPSSPPAHAAP